MNEADINIRETAEMVLYDLRKRKGVSIKGAVKHQRIVSQSKDRYSRIKGIDIPTLVVHGTSDPIIPIEHGKKLAEAIKGSSMLRLENVGHIFPFPDMECFSLKLFEFFQEVNKRTTD
jgi:pimeloyl-ACP methyl ester carboxylesterase